MSSSADLAIVGASVETITRQARHVDAVAVRAGSIVAVGSSAEVRELIGPRTEIIELHGETVLPGFQDAHVHPISGGLLADRCNLHGMADASAVREAVRGYAAAHRDRPWIVGDGWSLTDFPGGEPSRDDLDAIVGDRPAYLESNDGHVAWVSSAALAVAGITANTPDPLDGRIVRDEHGEPSGTLVDGAANLVFRHVPAPTHVELVRAIRAAQGELHRLGITAWQDAHVEAAELAAYREAAADGWLTARVVAALWWDRSAGLEQIERFEAQRAEGAIGRLRADSVKLMLDGILESRTAWLTEPYLGGDGGRGMPFVDPAVVVDAVAELDRRGFGAHFHAIGDAAVRLSLDAVAEARRRNGPTAARHHASHLELIHPDEVPRFAELDVTANIQPFWAVDDEQMRDLRTPALGPVRHRWQFVFESLRRAGARLAGGSDWTVTTANPLLEIEVAVRRAPPNDRDRDPLLPDERLSLDAALAAFTVGSAWVNGLERETGTIEVGKRADLVVLDRNLRELGGAVGDAHVVGTWVEGARVFGED